MACIFFTPFFTAVYNKKWLMLQTIYVYAKQGNYSIESMVYNQDRIIMAQVRYSFLNYWLWPGFFSSVTLLKQHTELSFSTKALHRGAFCQFPFRWIYYCHSSKSTGKETGKTHLCALKGWQFKNGILLPKLFCLTVRKIVLVIEKNFWNSRLKAKNLQKFWDH